MRGEFSRASVATLIAAIIGSVLDPGDAVPGRPHPPRQSPAAILPDAEARLSDLMRHFDFRFHGYSETGMPPWLRSELVDIRWMLNETMDHQASFGSPSVPEN